MAGTDPWLIKHAEMDKWLGVYGWTPAKAGALRFSTAADASTWAKSSIPNADFEVKQASVEIADPGTDGFATPFGYDTHVR